MDSSSVEFIVLVLAVIFVPGFHTSESWNYEEGSPIGPENWHYNYSMCGGSSQSPINVIVTHNSNSLSGLTLQNYDKVPASQFTLLNDGHSAKVTVNAKTMTISGAELGSTYILEQFHFHWGPNNSVGSEHTVGGKVYPLEIHFVHYKSTYNSVTEASANVNDTTAIAVLGVFVDVSSETSKQSAGLADVVNKLTSITNDGDSTTLSQFALSSLIPCRQSFYRYNGSLTTPACAEVVIWTVFTQPIYIDQTKLTQFRQLNGADHAKLVKNYRPSQEVGSRIVYHYEDTTICTIGEGNRLGPSLLAVWLMAISIFVSLWHQ